MNTPVPGPSSTTDVARSRPRPAVIVPASRGELGAIAPVSIGWRRNSLVIDMIPTLGTAGVAANPPARPGFVLPWEDRNGPPG